MLNEEIEECPHREGINPWDKLTPEQQQEKIDFLTRAADSFAKVHIKNGVLAPAKPFIPAETLRLVCAIIPGLMARYKEPGYTSEYMLQEAFRLADLAVQTYHGRNKGSIE